MLRTCALKTRINPGPLAKRNSFLTELVGEEVTFVGSDVGSEGDRERLFKTDRKDLRERSSAED